MLDLWLTVAEASLLEQVTERQIRARAAEGRIVSRRELRGKNANALLVAFSSLSPAAQARYYSQHPEVTLPPAGDPHADSAGHAPSGDGHESTSSYALAPQSIRQRADLRLEAVLSWRRALNEARHANAHIGDAQAAWIARFRRQHPHLKISLPSVKRWDRAYRAEGLNGLVDGNDGSGRRGKRAIHPELETAFRALWLRPTRPHIQDCYEQIRKLGEVQQLPVPSYSTFRRFATSLPEIAIRALRNEEDSSIRPFVQRDYTSIGAMEIIQSDHHQADVAVHCGDELCIRGHYPWITVWFDVRSRRILDSDLYVDHPNSQRILSVFKRVVRDNGAPGAVYLDNGLDYKKAFGWGVKYREFGKVRAQWLAVDCSGAQLEHRLAPLGARVMFATPYNAQAKAIERFFRTLLEGVYRRFDSYRGALGERSERAEYLRQHPEELPHIREFALALQREIDEYNAAPHSGQGMAGKSPNEVFAETRIARRDVDALTLSLVFYASELRTVDKGGIRFRKALYRFDDAAVQFKALGEKVRIRFDEENPDELVVTTLAGEFLGLAHPREWATYSTQDQATKDAIAMTNREWKAIKRLIRKENPAAAKQLEKVASSLEEYEALRAAHAPAAMPMAASGGGAGVVQLLPYESTLSKAIAGARERIGNPSGLSAADLQLARSIDVPANDELAELARHHSYAGIITPQIGSARPAGEDDDIETADVVAELEERRVQRLLVEREADRMCRYDIECPNPQELDGFCSQHWNRVHGR